MITLEHVLLKQVPMKDMKTHNEQGKSTNEIFNQLKVLYNDQAPSCALVARWITCFKNGRESIGDAPLGDAPGIFIYRNFSQLAP